MKPLLSLLAASSILLAQQPGDAEKLIAAADCSGCHAVDHQIVGPAYSDIAKRYAGQSDAVAKLSARIRDGGGGMTAHPNLTEAQRGSIVAWILTQTAAPVKTASNADAPFSPFAEGKLGKVTRDVFHGYQFFNSYCYRCHGTDATGGQLAPDLRHSLTAGMTQQAFMAIAMTGKADKGMPAWAGFLTEGDVTDIYKYVKGRSLDLIPVGRPASEQDK